MPHCGRRLRSSSVTEDTVPSKQLKVESQGAGRQENVKDEEVSSDLCSICYEDFNFKTTLPDCGHSFCFLCIKGVALRVGSCPLCRNPVQPSLFERPSFCSSDHASSSAQVREQNPQPRTLAGGESTNYEGEVKWLYRSRGRGWWRFEPRQERDLEAAYSAGERIFELIIAGFPYVIDFDIMREYRKDLPRSTLWERAIKRIVEDGSSKGKHVYVVGVAGVKQKRDVEG
ncbi:unnamed protein product [Enterobius vermicularis]|uniref:E3 ubiquitin-protein ligase n=1 Tax=Enterobius vermicularis TaxID=51028 RepID=A0A0N4UX02_ENTVE|nr:unnamed protein product [Enterobius vermicularis]